MKLAEGMKKISDGWVRKPKGFRVKYEQIVDDKKEVLYTPGLDLAPLDSDVTTWRYAWKLWQATNETSRLEKDEEMFNIHVVDDNDEPVVYYATGQLEVFNPR